MKENSLVSGTSNQGGVTSTYCIPIKRDYILLLYYLFDLIWVITQAKSVSGSRITAPMVIREERADSRPEKAKATATL